MPDLSTGWAFLRSSADDFAVAYPDSWEDLSNEVDYRGPTLLSEETYAETGLADDAVVNAQFVRGPDGVPNLALFRFEGVTSDTATIYAREAERFANLDDIEEVLERDLETCLGGTTARGIALSFDSEGEIYYQRNFFAVRDDVLYIVQWLDRLNTAPVLMDEILTTWGWTLPPLGSGGDDVILSPATAAEIEENGDAPDPSTFTATFGTDAPEVYVVFDVADGADGVVDIVWLREGEELFTNSLDLSPGYEWAWGALLPPSSGLEPGDYEVRLELDGEEHVLPFVVGAP